MNPETNIEQNNVLPIENQNIPVAPPVTQEKIESENEINWKKFREAREADRKRSEELAKRATEKEAEAQALKAALESVLNQNQRQQQYSNNEYDEESEDDKIEKKVNALLAKREAEAARIREQEEQESYPQKLKQIHSDFDQICSSENLDYLDYHHPELAKSLGKLPQSFEKWNDIYKAVKRYVPNPDSKRDVARAESNLNKPQSLSSPGMTQSSNAMPPSRLDDKRKAENYARMQRIIKGLS